MKICLISAANNVHTMRWANVLSDRGHSVVVISLKSHAIDEKVKYRENITIIYLRFPAGIGYYLNARQLKHLIKEGKYDVVNIHYASGYGTLGRHAKLKNALLNIWGSDVYEFPYKSKFNMKTIKKNLSYYNFVASTSNCMARQANSFINREYYITPFGVDTTLFKPMTECAPKDKIIFGTVKTLSPKYGIADTIKAFIKLVNRLYDEGKNEIATKLVYEIYGRGEQHDELQKLIQENGMNDKIKLCGYVPNNLLPQIYNRFIVCNCNSLNESFGVAAVEAMACGIPVQVSDAEGFAEVVEDGVTGLIAPKNNIDIIVDNMYKLLMMSEEERNAMGRAGVERVKRLYEWQSNVDSMEKIYHAMVSTVE